VKGQGHLAIDLDEALHQDLLHLLAGKRVLETVTEDEHEGKALAELVGTGRRARGLTGYAGD
jgi:hypothetical protein